MGNGAGNSVCSCIGVACCTGVTANGSGHYGVTGGTGGGVGDGGSRGGGISDSAVGSGGAAGT